MKKTIAAAVIAAPSIALGQASIGVETETLVRVGNEVRANFSVTNGTGRAIRSVFVECTFFDGDKKPFNTQTAVVSNLQTGEKAFGKATIIDLKTVKTAECRYSQMTNN
jgi:hypothetical protein